MAGQIGSLILRMYPAGATRRYGTTTAIIARKVGKLANRLILFAHLVSAAREHRFRLVNLAFDEYAQYFEHFKDALWPGYPVHASWAPKALSRRARHLSQGLARLAINNLIALNVQNAVFGFVRVDQMDELYDLGSEEFLSLVADTRIVAVQGWGLRDNTSFRRHADFIRQLFAPVSDIRQDAAKTVSDARSGGGVLIGVHMRRGDYREFHGGSFFYEPLEYRRMMEHLAALIPQKEVAFLICSDEEVNLDEFAGLNVVPGHGLHVVDLFSLAGCDYLIGPPSSFSLWASFYGSRPLCWMRSSTDRPMLTEFSVRFPGQHFDL